MSLAFGFTAQDEELFGGRRYVDPLGIGPVRTNLARRLVPHLNLLSSRAEGFELLLSSVALHEEYAETRGQNRALSFRDFYILLEQAFAYSTYLERGEWKLPGSRVVRASTGNIRLSLEYQLLDSQFSGGTWGQYSAAAERARLITTEPPRIVDDIRDRVRTFLGKLDTRSIFSALERAGRESYTVNRADWRPDLARIVTKIPHREILRTNIIDAPVYSTPLGFPLARPALLKEVAQRLVAEFSEQVEEGDGDEEPKVNEAALRRFVKRCAETKWDADRFGDAKAIFSDILVGESYLAPLETLFDSLFGFHGSTLADVTEKLEIPISEIVEAGQKFQKLRYWSATARERAILYSGLSFESPRALIENLVSVHAKVAGARGRHPWLSIEEGRVMVLVDQRVPEKPQLSPSRAWRHHYYLTSLFRVARGLNV